METILHPATSSAKHRTDLWNFPTVSIKEMLDTPNAIENLYTDKTNGYLIKNFMSAEEVQHALSKFNSLESLEKGIFGKGEGHSLPRSFSMLASESGVDDKVLESYLRDIEAYYKHLELIFPFGYEKRLFEFFSAIEQNTPVLVPHVEIQNEKKYFTSSTIRICYPYRQGLKTHVGNMFRGAYPAFYNYLDKLMDVDGQISYFVMLSKPEQGGDLVLFDALWGDYIAPTDDDKIIKSTGGAVLQTELDYQLISPEPGDMILFNGGTIWHKVDKLKGIRDRVTIGGFLAKTKDNSKIYCWA